MRTKILSLILVVTLLPFNLFAQSTKPLSGMCIVLVHGILGFDDTKGLVGGLVKYWGGLDTYLRNQGAKVATPGSSAANSLTVRSQQTKEFLDSWMPANGCSKIHLVGHSQGGLVVRHITSNLGYASKVSTVTSVNSLHNGAPMADIVLGVIPSWLQPFANVTLGLLAGLVYRDGRPQDVIAMGQSLTVSFSKSFSNNAPNKTGVKYYSYGTQMAWADPIQHPIMALTYPITWAGGLFYGMGTGNDGVVPYSSQRWGTWKGSPSSYWYATGIDHLQATNFSYTGQNFFDIQGWYLQISQNAKAGL
jgi:triacylglycerol lipase